MLNTSAEEAKFIFNKKYQLFLNFISHTEQAQNAIQYIETIIPNIIAHKTLKESSIKYLDIGCGYGDKTLSIINLIKKYHSISTTAIDPSPELLSIFKNQFANKDINLQCSPWESYQLIENFDLITSIHTFYYIDDWEAAINKMLTHLNKSGTILIVIRSDDEVCKFKDYFFQKINSPVKKERNFSELCTAIKQMKLKHTAHIVESKLNIENCLLENEKGKQLIEFLLRTSYSDLADNIKDEIKEYLKNNQRNGCLTHQDGFIWVSAS